MAHGAGPTAPRDQVEAERRARRLSASASDHGRVREQVLPQALITERSHAPGGADDERIRRDRGALMRWQGKTFALTPAGVVRTPARR